MDLSITVNGMKFPNPFLLGSGPPGARRSSQTPDLHFSGRAAGTRTRDLRSPRPTR